MAPKNVRMICMLGSMFLYIISLIPECYCAPQCVSSFAALLVGWMGLYSLGASLSWLANPAIWLAWMYLKRKPKRALGFAIAATLLAASFLLFDEVVTNEAGHMGRIISYKAGYWLWLSSMVFMLGGSIVVLFSKNKEEHLHHHNQKKIHHH